jgi:ABC-type glutathione transport system ATPase component
MTPLLSFSRVSKRYPDGSRDIVVLDRVSFEVEAGARVGVYGARREGKSTLLRIAAGIELPDDGAVRFDGRDLGQMSMVERAKLLRGKIAFMAAGNWRPNPGDSVVEHLATSLGSGSLPVREAKRRALQALDQVGVGAGCAEEFAGSLGLVDRTRVMLARALVWKPRLLIVDEPALMPSLGDRDQFYALLRSIAYEQEMALLLASEEMAALQGVRPLMWISDGELNSTEERGTVVQLSRQSVGGTEHSTRSRQRQARE